MDLDLYEVRATFRHAAGLLLILCRLLACGRPFAYFVPFTGMRQARLFEIQRKSPDFGFDLYKIRKMAQTKAGLKHIYSLVCFFTRLFPKHIVLCRPVLACSWKFNIYLHILTDMR